MSDTTPERIYLVPDDDGHSWCEDPAPGIGMETADAVEYVRADALPRPAVPYCYWANTEDPDKASICWNESDAQTEVNDHGGEVIAFYRHPPAPAVPEGWISVTDRLPTEDDYGEHDDVLVRYRYTDEPGRPWSVGESQHDPEDEYNGGWCFGSCKYAEVSHWMPKSALLAAAPAEVSGDATAEAFDDVAEILLPYLSRHGLPGSVIESVQMLLDHWLATRGDQFRDATKMIERHWISVSERLPKDCVAVLCYQMVAPGFWRTLVAYLREGVWCEIRYDGSDEPTCEPSGWMLLPEPPRYAEGGSE